jgi:hypothetical protein
MKADTSLHKSYPPRGICLITGEDTPKAGISTTARFLELELAANSIDLSKLKACQEKHYQYSYAFKGYIEWLLPQMHLLPDMLKRMFGGFRNQFLNKETHGRLTETIAWLLIGLEMLLTFYTHIKAIDNGQKEKTLEIAFEQFTRLAKRHALNLNSHDPVMLFTEGLRDLINAKAVTIVDIKSDPCSTDRNFIGWEDPEFYYLILGSVMTEINHYFQGQGIRFPVSKIMLSKMLVERQLIDVELSGTDARNVGRAYVGTKQKQTRVLKLKKSALL